MSRIFNRNSQNPLIPLPPFKKGGPPLPIVVQL